MYGQKQKPKLSVRIKASDQLNQMEGVYITKVEAMAVQTVELVICTVPDPEIVDGKLLPESERHEKPPVVPVG